MKKVIFVFFVSVMLTHLYGLSGNSKGILLLNITTTNKVSHEKVFLNNNAGKYEKLVLTTENNSVKVTRMRLEFDDGNDLVISQNFYVSKDDNNKEIAVNRPGRILVQITVYIISSEDKDEKTVFNIYGIK
jgi:hypothetical protein